MFRLLSNLFASDAPARSTPIQFRPGMEAMEDRHAPALVSVAALPDSGDLFTPVVTRSPEADLAGHKAASESDLVGAGAIVKTETQMAGHKAAPVKCAPVESDLSGHKAVPTVSLGQPGAAEGIIIVTSR